MLFFISFGNVLGGGGVKHPTYVSEEGTKIPCIVVKEINKRDRTGKEYRLYEFKVCGNNEEEVIQTLQSLRKKLKVK